MLYEVITLRYGDYLIGLLLRPKLPQHQARLARHGVHHVHRVLFLICRASRGLPVHGYLAFEPQHRVQFLGPAHERAAEHLEIYGGQGPQIGVLGGDRITSYNVCYTKLLRTYGTTQCVGPPEKVTEREVFWDSRSIT